MKKKTGFSRLVAGLTAFLLVLTPMPFGEMGISNGIGMAVSAEESTAADENSSDSGDDQNDADNGDDQNDADNGDDQNDADNGEDQNDTDNGDENSSDGGENGSNEDEAASDGDESDKNEAVMQEAWISDDDNELADSDELFSEYVDRVFYGYTDIATFSNPDYGYQSLTTEGEKEIYNSLKPIIAQIASGKRASTAIELQTTNEWVYSDKSFRKIHKALLSDLPYDLYWYDKTEGIYVRYDTSSYKNFIFSFTVSADYAGSGEYTVDTAKTGAASNAAANAKEIVDNYAKLSDYSKLYGYLTTICDLVEYDHDAVKNDRDYGDPWQIIYAFDNDPSTNIVCEGYSKAFKYLCDLSTFKNTSISCAIATGNAGGPHMWNIVSIDDVSYTADLTNCDSGSFGYPSYIFLKGMKNPTATGFTAVGINGKSLKYTYDSDMTSLYSSEFLTVSDTDYVSNEAKCTVNVNDDALTLYVNGEPAESSSVTVYAGDELGVSVRIKDILNKKINYTCTGATYNVEKYYNDDYTCFWDELDLADFEENGAKLDIDLADSEWSEEELAKYVKLDKVSSISVYPYSTGSGEPNYDDPLTNDDYYPVGMKVRITAGESEVAQGPLCVNGVEAVGSFNSDRVYEADFYLTSVNGTATIIIANTNWGYIFNAGSGITGYVNGGAIGNGTFVQSGKVIEFKVKIDDLIDHKLMINDLEYNPTLDDVYHRFLISKYTVSSSNINAELVEEKWDYDKLSKYVKLVFDDGLMVFAVDGNSEYDADQQVEPDAIFESGEYYTKGYYIEIYASGEYAKGRDILINNKSYKLNLDKKGNYYLRYLVNCQEDTLNIEFESKVSVIIDGSKTGFDTLDEALAYIKKNGSGKDITVLLNHEMTITKLAIPTNVSSFWIVGSAKVKISFDMTTLAVPVNTTFDIWGDGENLKPITISVAAGKTLDYNSFTHYGEAVTVKGTNTSVLNINNYLTVGGISTFGKVNVADNAAVSVEGNVTGVKLFNGDLWLKDPKYTATITTFGKGTVRLYDCDGKNAKVTVTDVDEHLNVQLVDPNTKNFTAVESGRTILWAGSTKDFTGNVTVSNQTPSGQPLNAYLYGKEIKAEYGGAITVDDGDKTRSFPNLDLALKSVTDPNKQYTISLNEDAEVSKLTLPKTADTIVFNGSGTLKLNMTALSIPVNTSFYIDVIGTNAKPLAITVTAGKTLLIGRDAANIGAVKGTNTSKLYVLRNNTVDSIATFERITVGNDAVLTVKGNVTALSLLRGNIALPNVKSTAVITKAEGAGVILTDVDGKNAKVTLTDVVDEITVCLVDSSNNIIKLQNGRSILTAGGKTDFTGKVTVKNLSTSDKQLNAFLYGKDIRAEYAGAITLDDGTDTKNYPNLDLAFKAVNDVSKDYTLTLNEDITVSKLTIPKTAKSITFDGTGSLNLNMTALTLPVDTTFKTVLYGVNAKPLAITVAAGKKLDLSIAFKVTVKGTKTSVLNINDYARLNGIATFGEVNVADRTAVSVDGNVTAVTHFNGNLYLKNPKYTANITNFGTGKVVIYEIDGKIAKLTVGNIDDNGKLRMEIVDNYTSTLPLADGRTLLYAGGKDNFTERVTIVNESTTGKQLTAFLYGKEIRAEYAGAITLDDGTDAKNYPNLDLAFKAVNDASKDYTLTLNENITVSKLTIPKTAKSITFDGTDYLKLNMTALALPVDTTFETNLVGANAKPLAITVAAGKKLDLSKASNITVKGTKTSVLNISSYATINGISTFGEVNVADGIPLDVDGSVTAVTHFNGALWLMDPKNTANITNFGTGEIVLCDIDGKIAKVTVGNVDANGELRVRIINSGFDPINIAGGKTLLYAGGKDNFTERVTIANTSTTRKKLTAFLYGKEIRAEYAEAVTLLEDGREVLGKFPNLDLAFKQIGNSAGNYTIQLNDGIAVSKLTLPKNAISITFNGEGSLDLNMTALAIPTNTFFYVPIKGTNAKPLAITVAAGKGLAFSDGCFVSNIGAVKGGKDSIFSNKEENTVDSIASITNLMAYKPLTVTGNVTGVTYFEGKFKLPNAKSTFTATYFVGDASIGLVDNNGSFAKVTTSGVGSLDKYLDITVLDGNGNAITLPSGKTVLYSSAKYDITNYIRITNKTSANNDLTAKPYGKEIKAVNAEAVSLKADGNKIGSFATLEEAFAAMNESKKYVLTINDDLCVTKFVFPTKAISVYIGGSGNTLFLSNISAITVNCDITFENITISNTKSYTLTAKKNLTLYNVTSDCLTAIKGTSSHIYDERENNLTFTGKNGTEQTKITGFGNRR